MGQDETAGQLRGTSSRRLPVELAELLTPPLEHALNHPLRREILRALNRSDRPRTAAELVSACLPATSVTLLNYHAAVLERCDLVRTIENEVAGEGFSRHYASSVAEDVQIIAILSATEALDRGNG
ncbi:MAG: Helix-turn-helix domain [Solirubrobacterales bacterium]|jgi:DNA-binding transcriptional ArsR family regulator|nr:Helix-turn-helix domain [Solirubrobacterales bacterium]